MAGCLIGLMSVVLVAGSAATARAPEGEVVYHDPSCGYFIVKLPGDEGYGLFESRSGPAPAVGDVIEGDIVTGEQIDVVNKTTGATNRLIHWANAAASRTLIRNFPFQCTSRWQLKD
jgi:hypothetical protein